MISRRGFVLTLYILSGLVLSSLANLPLDEHPYFYIYELDPRTEAQWLVLRGLIHDDSGSFVILNDNNVDTPIEMLVAREKVAWFKKRLQDVGMKYQFLGQNTQNQLEVQSEKEYNWKQYHTLNDTYDWMRYLSKTYPEQVSLFVAGKSYEGRDLLGIRISYGEDKQAIFLEGGIHAREWISPATTTFIAYQLLTSKNKDVRTVAESFDWYILPHVNPDGYVYTYTTDRLWRKTRSPQANGCYGVDLNRNWDTHWNEVDSNEDPCANTYAGTKPFSEIETRSLADFITKLKSRLFIYVAFHSFRQKLLYPYGYTSDLPSNVADYRRVYKAAISALSRRHGTKYTGGNIFDNMYPASGTSSDWAYSVAGVEYSFAYELCPSNSKYFDFRLPAARIIPTGEETLDSLVAMVKEAGLKDSDEINERSDAGINKVQSLQVVLVFYLFLSIIL